MKQRKPPYYPPLSDQTHYLAFAAGAHLVSEPSNSHDLHEAFAQWRDEAQGRIAAGTLPHQYTSTACQHGLHAECRTTCKFCDILCGCVCHSRVPL